MEETMNQARNWQTEHVQTAQPKKKIVVKIKKRSRVTKGEKIIYSFFGLGLILASLFVVSFSSKTDTLNREIQVLEKDVYNQKLENEALQYEKSELSSPDRITKIARENGLKIQDAKVKRITLVKK